MDQYVEQTFIKLNKDFSLKELLDYEYDSDDDWEEEEPGESLSDCEVCTYLDVYPTGGNHVYCTILWK